MVMQKRIKFRGGEIVLVPLKSGGFARGLIVRSDSKSKLFGRFFWPRLYEEAPLDQSDIRSGSDIWCKLFLGDGLQDRRWKVVSMLVDWSAEDWPLPKFKWRPGYPYSRGPWYEITLSEGTLEEVSRRIAKSEVGLVDNDIANSRYVEAILDDLLPK